MDPSEILAKAYAAARNGRRRFFDPDRDRLVSRNPVPDIREHADAWRYWRDEYPKLMLSDAIRRGLTYERCAPHHALFLKAMDRSKEHYDRAARAWASGATDHIPAPAPDLNPVIDLAEALLGELEPA